MKAMIRSCVIPLVLACMTWHPSFDSWAQNYPTRPVRYILSTSPGSSLDVLVRILTGEKGGLTDILGVQVLVDNRPGAAGNIGAAIAAKAPADGYTWLQVNINHTANAAIYSNLAYDLLRDFEPVTRIAANPWILVNHPSLPVRSTADLIKLAKARPGAIGYSSAGPGSGTHMVMSLFTSMAGVKMLHVPYKGGGEALNGVITGETPVYFAPLGSAMPYVRQGRLRALAVSTAQRLPLLPDYPAVAETVPGFEFTAWTGLVVPAKTPKPVIAAIHKSVITALEGLAVKNRLANLGYIAIGDRPEEFESFLKSDLKKMAQLVKALGLAAKK
jgi:tripartite-type tricarboxylate transporter receptor subunit TctC